MKKEEINRKTQEVYEFTAEYLKNNGFPPSVREICAKLNIKSTATAYAYIERLKNEGLIDKCPQKKRAIKLPQAANNIDINTIPLVGVIRAGEPIYAVENLEGYYPLPPDFNVGGECFALRVKGDSMINAGIYDRDVIIVKKQNTAENGEIVVALTEDGATVKRLFIEKNRIVLHPENDAMTDLIYTDVEILGTVKGLYRKF